VSHNAGMFSWLSTAEADRFGRQLADFLLKELSGSLDKPEAKFAGKVEKVLLRADQQVTDFKRRNKLNFLQRSKLANRFLWTLREGGCSQEYAGKLTDWLTIRL
jgi:hypothetical protein